MELREHMCAKMHVCKEIIYRVVTVFSHLCYILFRHPFIGPSCGNVQENTCIGQAAVYMCWDKSLALNHYIATINTVSSL